MYIMPTRRYGSEVKEPKDILERMQLQALMPTTLKTIDTITPGGSCLSPDLFPNNKGGPLAAPVPSNVAPIKSQSRDMRRLLALELFFDCEQKGWKRRLIGYTS